LSPRTFLLEDAIFFVQAASSSRSAGVISVFALSAVGPCTLDRVAERRFGEEPIVGSGGHRLALVEDQPDGPALKSSVKLR
jgi:hypothetical protein